MKIEKFVKDSSNKYKVTIDGETYILYDDVILKYELIRKDSIDDKLLKEVIKFNDELKSYYDSIKYINKKLRTKKEIYEYLKKRGIEEKIINLTIKRLKDNNFLNEEIYLKCYIADQINLSNNGPKKIKANLIKLGIDEEMIDDYLSKFDESIWVEKIDQYINKKIKTNHTNSEYMLKNKIKIDLLNLGYDKELIDELLYKYDIIDKDILKKEVEKAKRELGKKYVGKELEQKIKMRLYRKGFKLSEYEDVSYEE